MQIADDVERPVVVPLVVPQGRPLNRGRLDFLGRVEDEDVREALPLQPPDRPAQLRFLLPDHVRPEVPVLPATVSLLADLLGQVEDQGHRKAVVLPSKLDQRLAGLGLDVGGIHDGQMSQGQPLSGDEVQNLECLVGRRLVVLVVADHSTAGIGRKHLRGQEVLAGKGALARAAGADEDDEGEVGDGDGHSCYSVAS